MEYATLIQNTLGDGGNWGMFVGLIEKYGIVPKSIYPDNYQSKSTAQMNIILETLILQSSLHIHTNTTRSAFQSIKLKVLENCYRVINMFLGNAPVTFVWSHVETQKEHVYTPLSFYKKILKPLFDPTQFVCIAHNPTERLNSVFGVEYTSNITESGQDIKRSKYAVYANIPLSDFKVSVFNTLKKGTAVWFACDVNKFWLDNFSVLDQNASNLNDMLDLDISLEKGKCLKTRTIIPNHAMVFTGVHKNGNIFERWKVENSHGAFNNNLGFSVMSDKWFEHFVICAAVPKNCLPKHVYTLLNNNPKVKWLPYWSILGKEYESRYAYDTNNNQ